MRSRFRQIRRTLRPHASRLLIRTGRRAEGAELLHRAAVTDLSSESPRQTMLQDIERFDDFAFWKSLVVLIGVLIAIAFGWRDRRAWVLLGLVSLIVAATGYSFFRARSFRLSARAEAMMEELGSRQAEEEIRQWPLLLAFLGTIFWTALSIDLWIHGVAGRSAARLWTHGGLSIAPLALLGFGVAGIVRWRRNKQEERSR